MFISSLDLVFQFDQSTYFVNEGGSVPVTVTWVNPQQGVGVRVTVEAVTPSGTRDDFSISPENITLSTASNTSVVVITARSDKMKEDPQDEDFTLSLESSFRLSVPSATLTISDTSESCDDILRILYDLHVFLIQLSL